MKSNTSNDMLRQRQKMLAEAEVLAKTGSFEWNIMENKVTWSDGLYHIYGLKPQEFGASFEAFLERIHPKERQRVSAIIEKAARDGEPFEMEERIIRADGKQRDLFSRGVVVMDRSGRPARLIGVCQDVTESKLAEQARIRNARLKAEKSELEKLLRQLRETQTQLIQSEKMAALGKLVANMVHELNTPIGTLNSSLDVNTRSMNIILDTLESANLIDHLKNKKTFLRAVNGLRENNRSSRNATDRLSKIVRSLKIFINLDGAGVQRGDIHESLESVITLLEPELRNGITIQREFGNIPKIFCFPGELNQMFMNLLQNAIQATEGPGCITISTDSHDDAVMIRIADTGHGISPDMMPRLFEPTLSQKGRRVKSGIGLFSSYQIIRKHGGTISAESTPGKGAVFSITLPVDFREVLK